MGGPVTALKLAVEWDRLPLGLGLSFISKWQQMVGLALAPSTQSPKVHFCDGCGEWECCREDWGTSAQADNRGQSMSGLSSRQHAFTYYSYCRCTGLVRIHIFLSLFASHFHSCAFCSHYQQDTILFTVQGWHFYSTSMQTFFPVEHVLRKAWSHLRCFDSVLSVQKPLYWLVYPFKSLDTGINTNFNRCQICWFII